MYLTISIIAIVIIQMYKNIYNANMVQMSLKETWKLIFLKLPDC